MSPFSNDMFSLGFGSPEEPDGQPDPSKVINALEKLDIKVLESLMNSLQDNGAILAKVDGKTKENIANRLQSTNDSVERVATKLKTAIGNSLESASVVQSKLNTRARKDGFDLTSKASELMYSPKEGRTTTKLREDVRKWQQRTRLNPNSANFAQEKSSAIQDLRRVVAKSTAGSAKPIVPSHLIVPLIDAGIKPGEVDYVEIMDDGSVHVEHPGGVVHLDNPGTWPTPSGFTDPQPLPPQDEPQGDTPIPIPGVHDETPIEVVQELPITMPPETWPDGTVPGEIPDGSCPTCQMPVCVCQQEPGEKMCPEPGDIINVTNNYGDTRYENPPDYPGEVEPTEPTPVEVTVTMPPPEPKEEEEEPPQFVVWCNPETGAYFTALETSPPPGAQISIYPVARGKTPALALVEARGKSKIRWQPIEKDLGPAFVRDTRTFCSIHAYKDYEIMAFGGYEPTNPRNFAEAAFGLSGANVQKLKDRTQKSYDRGDISWLSYTAWMGFYGLADWINETFESLTGMWGVDIAGFSSDMMGRLVIGFLAQWITEDLKYLKIPFEYGSQEKLPLKFPSEIQAMNAFISGEIDADTWGLWTRMNGFCVEPMSKLINFHRTKFNPLQLLLLLRREAIDEETYKETFKQWGYMGDEDPNMFELMNRYVPPIQDLVRFMVRDVFDPQKRDIYAPDTGFTEKWSDKAKEYGEYQGIKPDVAELYWRAHWVMPPTGALYDFYHRNRVESPPGQPKFGYKELTEALAINDNNPKFIPYLIQSSQHLLTRVDVRRAYRLGILQDIDVENNYKMRGYSDKDASSLKEYAIQDKEQFLLARRETKLYRNGVIGLDEWRRAILKYNPTAEQMQYVEYITGLERRAPLVKKCIRYVEKQYIEGDIDMQEARVLLQRLGLAPDNVNDKVQELFCVKQHEPKSLTVGQLGERFLRGMIGRPALENNLEEIGYEVGDSMRIADIYESRLLEKQMKEFERNRKQRLAEARREGKEADAMAAKAKRMTEKMQKARVKRKQAEDRRQLRILKATQKLSKCLGIDLEVGTSLIQAALYGMETIYSYTSEERTTLIERSVDGCKEYSVEGFDAEWRRVADSFGRLEGFDLDGGTRASSPNIVNRIQTPGDNGSAGK